MSESKQILMSVAATQQLKVLFAGKTVVAIAKSGKAKFSDGDNEWTTAVPALPDGTYRVMVGTEDTIFAVKVEAPEPTLTEKVKGALGVSTAAKEPKPAKPAKVRTSGSAGGMSMAAMRR